MLISEEKKYFGILLEAINYFSKFGCTAPLKKMDKGNSDEKMLESSKKKPNSIEANNINKVLNKIFSAILELKKI